jgi:hypothetical protein
LDNVVFPAALWSGGVQLDLAAAFVLVKDQIGSGENRRSPNILVLTSTIPNGEDLSDALDQIRFGKLL